MSKVDAFLTILAAAPKLWRVTTRYADGSARVHETSTRGGAENWAAGERRKVGRELIRRDTGAKVCVVSVEISRVTG